jgi:hypothetical protein
MENRSSDLQIIDTNLFIKSGNIWLLEDSIISITDDPSIDLVNLIRTLMSDGNRIEAS